MMMMMFNKIRATDLFMSTLFKRLSSTSRSSVKKTSFDKQFYGIVNKTIKPWERDGFPDRETWFKKKYAHIHVKQKQKQAHLEQLAKLHELKRQKRLSHIQKYKNIDISKKRKSFGNTPLMEYIYGTNCVISALSNKNRDKVYRLLYSNESVFKNNPQLSQLVKERNLKTVFTNKHELNLLTKNAVHNGLVLEAKPLDPLEITHLGPVNVEEETFQINKYHSEFDSPSSPSSSSMNILNHKYMLKQSSNKLYPLGVYLDEVTDTHNLGAILRTSFYLGVDFIVISRKNCAQLSPSVNKCSSGAMEYIPIYMVDKPLTFFDKSRREGQWTFITSCIEQNNKKISTTKLPLIDMQGLLERCPVILVVGNEGSGVRTNLQLKSDFVVQIPFGGPVESQSNIDSLNVSVATAILLSNLLPSSSSL